TVEKLLQLKASMGRIYNDLTPLLMAAKLGHADIITALIRAAANVEFPDEKGWTPLGLAIDDNQVLWVSRLLECKADINTINTLAQDLSPLFFAVKCDDAPILQELLKGKANLNATNQYGESALHAAASGDYRAAMHVLLTAGINMEMAD